MCHIKTFSFACEHTTTQTTACYWLCPLDDLLDQAAKQPHIPLYKPCPKCLPLESRLCKTASRDGAVKGWKRPGPSPLRFEIKHEAQEVEDGDPTGMDDLERLMEMEGEGESITSSEEEVSEVETEDDEEGECLTAWQVEFRAKLAENRMLWVGREESLRAMAAKKEGKKPRCFEVFRD